MPGDWIVVRGVFCSSCIEESITGSRGDEEGGKKYDKIFN